MYIIQKTQHTDKFSKQGYSDFWDEHPEYIILPAKAVILWRKLSLCYISVGFNHTYFTNK